MVTIRSGSRTSIAERLNAAQSSSNFSRGTGSDDFFGYEQNPTNVDLPRWLNDSNNLTAEFGLPDTDEAARFLFGFTQDDLVDIGILVSTLGFANPSAVLAALGIDQLQPQSNLATALVELENGLEGFGFNFNFADTSDQAIRFIFANQAAFGWDTSSSESGATNIFELTDALVALESEFSSGVLGIDPGFLKDFSGDNRIFGRGGDDIVVDLEGNNYIITEDGDDQIYTGLGNDRITDKGGNNTIVDLGGNNNITLLGTTSFLTPDPGTDRVTTGDGNDNINAFDGRNFIDASDGDNIVRGGDNYDEFKVGSGDDFADLRGAFVAEDANGNGIIDLGEDGNFNGVLDPDDTETFAVLNIGQGFAAHNSAWDSGGSDNLRASGNDEGDDLVLSDVFVDEDTESFPGFRALTLSQGDNLGDDLIDLGAGDNLIIDAGGNDSVTTLFGEDAIYTSFFSPGDDRINSGAGNDTIVPGSGADMITGGAGGDLINLSDTATASVGDGDVDTLVYAALSDLSVSTFDLVQFFEFGAGGDLIDVSALDRDGDGFGDVTGFGPGGLNFQLNNFDGEGDGDDLLVGWDFGGAVGFELGVDPIIGVFEEFDGGSSPDNFILA